MQIKFATRQEFYDLAQRNPVLHVVLTHHQMGQIDFETALMTAAVILVQQNNELLKQAVDSAMRQSAPFSWLEKE